MSDTHDDDGRSDEPRAPASSHERTRETGPDAGATRPDPLDAREIARWRKAERERLISARMALSVAERNANASLIARDLSTLVPPGKDTIVSLYWPFRGEPDLRGWMTEITAAGMRAALPVVTAKGQPLQFREWTPGARLEKGVWNIPFPADGAIVVPTVVIAPLVGFDTAGYRLGYGGGFFDRTLASLSSRPLAIGVGHPMCAIETIYPQPHDIPMDWIVTGLNPPRKSSTRTLP